MTVTDLDAWAYDRYVEQPRRNGRDPVWDALLAEALKGRKRDERRTA